MESLATNDRIYKRWKYALVLSIFNRRIRRAINVITDPSAVSPTLYKAFIRGNYLSIFLLFSLSLSLSLFLFLLSLSPFLARRGGTTRLLRSKCNVKWKRSTFCASSRCVYELQQAGDKFCGKFRKLESSEHWKLGFSIYKIEVSLTKLLE